jgi:cell division protein FtsW
MKIKPFGSQSVDKILFGIVLLLLAIGLAVLYSASTVISYNNFGNTSYYFVHQLLYGALIGCVAMYFCSRIDYHIWQRLIPLLLFVALILLMLVKVPGIGFSANGATRWIHFGFITFQPAELAKFAVILYTAGWVAKQHTKLKDFYYGLFPALVIISLFALLVLWQPDMGTMLSMVLTALVMLFVAGMDLRYFAGVGAFGILALVVLVKLEPYRARRITTFLNPSFDPQGIGYQINQALIAIGSGGLWGYGYGMSRQKHNYLPEAIGDSIFAVMSEELGLIRVLVILALFLALAIRGLRVGMKAPDLLGKMLAIGIVSTITVQVCINIAAISGLLPLTGIPLPFFSYGSSAMIVMLAEVGILLNISRQARA